MKKKLFYIANMRMPTERAHGIQIMEMCQAFVHLGSDVELVVTNRKTSVADDPFVFYDIPESFKITKLWCLDAISLGRIGFWIQSVTFAERVAWYVVMKKGIFYTRDELLAVYLKLLGKNVAWETHMGRKNFFVKLINLFKIPIIAITEGLKDVYIGGTSPDNILVAPDGADISRFDIPLSKQDARKQLKLPLDKKIILYKGSLTPWKGAGTLAGATEFSKTSDTVFVFIGGNPTDVEEFKKEFGQIKNILILGNRPRKETPIYQKAADILVIPNSAKEDISKLYTSPMKLFGYMAGGVPIIASDLPSIKEILGESDAYFFTPDDAKSLGETIDILFLNINEAQKKATQSLLKVREYSWEKRARNIIDFLRKFESKKSVSNTK